jgi:transcriptional regulator with XRE-family HTH domain
MNTNGRDPRTPREAVGLLMRAARALTPYTQASLAEALGWGEITYHRYEKGARPIDVDQLYDVAALLDFNPALMLRLAQERWPDAFAGQVGLDPMRTKPVPLGEPDGEPDDMPAEIPLPGETEPEEESRSPRATHRGTAGR